MAMNFLRDFDVSGKRVFVRADLDVNVEQFTVDPSTSLRASSSQLTEATRLQNLKPTVDWLLEHGAKQIVIAGHIGRPSRELVDVEAGSGKPLLYSAMMTTEQLTEPLKKILGQEMVFCADFGHITDAKLLLFENLRFWPGEAGGDQVFANRLAILADVYVNDAFGNCHREHASMVLLPKLLQHAAGIHLEKEVNQLTKLIKTQERPFVAIIGGIKKETKLPVIVNLAKLADHVLIGGALVKELGIMNRELGSFSNVAVGQLTPDGEDLDEQTVKLFESSILGAKTVVWNGPLGHFESGHTKGSIAIAEAIVKSGAYSVVGGGETTRMLGKLGLLAKFGFVSSGGVAMLEFLAGKPLPGLVALE